MGWMALFMLLALRAMADETTSLYHISGRVVDSLSGKPEPYATVRLFHGQETMPQVTGLSELDGSFEVKTAQVGDFRLMLSCIGKTTRVLNVTLDGKQRTMDVGTVLLQASDNAIGEVTVTAQRPLVKAEVDKIGYSVADDQEAQSKTMLEMLRKVPMVTVDGDDNIKINGKGGFKVYVNGKPNQMMSSNPSLVLKNYPASAVKKVEVITNPGAKYDAEGTSGVLNIITNDNVKTSGYTLTPNLYADNRRRNANLYAMAQMGKLTFSFDGGMGRVETPRFSYQNARETYSEPVQHLFSVNGERKKTKGHFQYANVEASYELDDKNLLSASMNMFHWGGRERNHNLYNMYAADGSRTYGYEADQMSRHTYGEWSGSVDYQHTFDKPERTLTFSYRLNAETGHDKEEMNYKNFYQLPYSLTDLYSDPDNKSFEHTGQWDYSTPWGKYHHLSAGMKFIYRLNKSDNEEKHRISGTENPFERDEQASLRYKHQGYIGAAYAEYAYSRDSFKVVLGNRYEYYHTHVSYPDGKRESFENNMGDWVPSVSVGYNLSPTRLVRLSYNMRLGRPNINMLSPYVQRLSPENISYGNAALKSEKAHNLELAYSSFGTKLGLSTTLAYGFSNNGLTDYSFVDADNVLNTTYNNFQHNKILNLSQFVNWTIVNGTRITLNAHGSYGDLRVRRTGDHHCGFEGGFWLGLQQDLPWKLKLNVGGGGNTRSLSLQGWQTGWHFHNVSVNRSFLKDDRLTVQISSANVFAPYFSYRENKRTETYSTSTHARIKMFSGVGISLKYRIGSLNTQVKKAARTIENNDVKSGGKGNSGQPGANGR